MEDQLLEMFKDGQPKGKSASEIDSHAKKNKKGNNNNNNENTNIVMTLL